MKIESSISKSVIGCVAVTFLTAFLTLSGTISIGSTAGAANIENQWASPLSKVLTPNQPVQRLGEGMRTEAVPTASHQTLPPELKDLANPAGPNAVPGPGNGASEPSGKR